MWEVLIFKLFLNYLSKWVSKEKSKDIFDNNIKKENNTPMVKMKKYALLFEVRCFLFLNLEVEKSQNPMQHLI